MLNPKAYQWWRNFILHETWISKIFVSQETFWALSWDHIDLPLSLHLPPASFTCQISEASHVFQGLAVTIWHGSREGERKQQRQTNRHQKTCTFEQDICGEGLWTPRGEVHHRSDPMVYAKGPLHCSDVFDKTCDWFAGSLMNGPGTAHCFGSRESIWLQHA